MPELLSSIILGFVQGLTEFLPISSSGHLIVVRDALGISLQNSLLFDVLLHFATACAIVIYFRSDIKEMFILKNTQSKIMLGSIILGTIPAVILGLLFEDFIETTFRNSSAVALALIAGSLLFFIAERYATQHSELNAKKGFIIGIFQASALIPGVSRSGATISGGLLLGMSREKAARFSFLLGVPVIMAAGIVKLIQSYRTVVSGGIDLTIFSGALVAFITGLVAIHFLLAFLKKYSLRSFAWYRIALAIIILIFL